VQSKLGTPSLLHTPTPNPCTAPKLVPSSLMLGFSSPLLVRRSSAFFAGTQGLSIHGRPRVSPPALARPPLPRRRAVKLASASPLRAREFRTGAKIALIPATPATAHDAARFVVCPGCSSAYVGNAITAPTQVLCPSCKHKFSAAPDRLYVRFDSRQESMEDDTSNLRVVETDRKGGKDEIVCRHFAKCPACTIENGVSRPPILQQVYTFAKRALRLNGHISVEMMHPTGWRTHAKLAIRKDGFGLFGLRSHDVVRIPNCAIHHPRINEAAEALEKALLASSAKPYDEHYGTGGARYALFSVERHSGLVQVTIVWNSSSWKEAHPYASRLGAALWTNNRSLLHSVWFNWNVSRGNVILSNKVDAFYLMHGQADLVENIRGVQVPFPPSVFRQANLDAFENLLLPKLLSYIPPRSSVVELFAGVGVISLAALGDRSLQLQSVTCTEINEFAEAPFKKALRRLRLPTETAVNYLVGSDNDTVCEAVDGNASIVIVDPPRAGLSEYCVSELANVSRQSTLKRLIYVSCGFDAFRRDTQKLLEGSGGWRAHALHSFIFFPGGDHVELLAVFDRP
jgi:23S rRNA (uracil1939-C5)-methyltransferase